MERNLRVFLDAQDAERLADLADSAQVTAASWVRGAIRLAATDPAVASAVAAAAPPDARGGRRAGAGRPRRVSDPAATQETEHKGEQP